MYTSSSQSPGRRRPGKRLAALLLTVATVAAACGGSGDDASEATTDDSSAPAASDDIGEDTPDATTGEEPAESDGDKTDVTMWSRVPDLDIQIEDFEAANPVIDIDWQNVGHGGDQYTQLRTAIQAGVVPDVAHIEYQELPAFVAEGALVDVTAYGASELADTYAPGLWANVSGANGEVYGYPWDGGPMGMLYREDIFTEFGIEVPTTWDEFAQAAVDLREQTTDVFLTNATPADAGWWTAMLWQAGARPFQIDGTTVTVDLDDEPAVRVADYWGGLIADGVVSADPDFTPEWNEGFNSGKYATWIAPAWAPSFLQGIAEDTDGLWRVAPIPQWNEGDAVSSNWGGSTLAVIEGTDTPDEAARVAQWFTSEPESTQLFATEQLLFPSTNALLNSEEYTGTEVPFYGGQKVAEIFAEASANVDTEFQFPPFNATWYQFWTDAVGPRIESGDLAPALTETEERVIEFAEQQGFTIGQ